jgi:hypothetical protein
MTRTGLAISAAAVAALAVTVPATVPAKRHHHRRPPHIRINQWVVTTPAQGEAKAGPGSTFTHCATDVPNHLHVDGRFKRAVNGKKLRFSVYLNGARREAFPERWTVNGHGSFGDGIGNDQGLPDGRWVFKWTGQGHHIGRSSLTLAANPAC